MSLQRSLYRNSLYWLGALVLCACGTVSAATITVMATGSNTFSPSVVNINAGDSVLFKYGGGAPHNVVADDNSFRCAKGCDNDGAGGSGNVTTGWSFTKTFNTAGTIKYYCEAHGAPNGVGMAGQVIVHAATPSINVGGYLSGNWYNPDQGGHGFQLEFTKDAGLLAIWFVYSPDGTAQNWIYGQGAYDTTKNTVTVPAVLYVGAKFPPNFDPTKVVRLGGDLWGNMTFTFTDCNHGTVSWHSDLAGYNNANDTPLALTRLTQIDGTSCPQ